MSNRKNPSRQTSVDLSSSKRDSITSEKSIITASMNNLSITDLARRPGLGVLGDKVNALVNFFETNLSKVPDLFEYSFKISSDTKPDSQITARVKRRVAFLLLHTHQSFRFAASNYASVFISTRGLTQDRHTQEVYNVDYFEEEEPGPRSGDEKSLFTVLVTPVQRYDMEIFRNHARNQQNDYPLLESHIAALNIILARGPAQNLQMTNVARREKFFDITDKNGRCDLGHGLEAYKGFFRSARLTVQGLMVNLNTATAAMYWDGPLHELIDKIVYGKEFSTMSKRIAYLNSQLRLLRIETSYRGKRARRTVLEVARPLDPNLPPTSANITFTKDNSRITVADYFRTTYPTTRRPNVNAFVVDVGTRGRQVYVPSDLCTVVPGQPYRGFLPQTSQTTKMIRFACRKPAQNAELILTEGLKQMGVVGVAGGPMDRFGFNIRNQMASITARLLPRPTLNYASGRDTGIGSGQWNMSKKVFKIPAPERSMRFSWVELLLPRKTAAQNRAVFLRDMEKAIQTYTGYRSAKILNFEDGFHNVQVTPNFVAKDMTTRWNYLRSKGVSLVFVILPNKSAQIYQAIKTSADTMGPGIHTVCTVRDEITGNIKVGVGELANEVLKVNPKLGGVNLTLQFPAALNVFASKKLMFIGADVLHPGTSAMTGAPSVASVVASIDDHFFLYPGSYRLQVPETTSKKAVEFIRSFGDMCEERLALYNKVNKVLPDVVLVYRDGVADNMFAEVINEELTQLQQVYKRVYTNRPSPKTIFTVVKKRGHTRFFQPRGASNKAFDRNGNPVPGFVVDSHITSGKVFDWYLVSHICLQGTSRPAHYVVLHNDFGATADQLQHLTYSMCFLWGRSTKSIGIHPAARAADTMCDRAKVYLHSVFVLPPEQLGDNRPTYSASGGHWPGVIAPNLRDTMFYI